MNLSRISAPPMLIEFDPLVARSKRMPGCFSPLVYDGDFKVLSD